MDLQTLILIVVLFILIAMLLVRAYNYAVLHLHMRKVKALVGGGFDRKHQKSNRRVRVKDLAKHPRSKSEAEVIRFLEELTEKKFPTVYPGWLVWKGRELELDGYNESAGIGLEFSGPLHTKWNPAMEEYTSYFDRIVKDVVKIRVCRKNSVNLIVVDTSLPRMHWRNYIVSRLYDIHSIRGITEESHDVNTIMLNSVKPPNYINEQTAVPYRNAQIEAELGLEAEMTAALKI